jgi:hypothetical protein
LLQAWIRAGELPRIVSTLVAVLGARLLRIRAADWRFSMLILGHGAIFFVIALDAFHLSHLGDGIW